MNQVMQAVAARTALSAWMHMPWHMVMTWGLLVGSGTGVAANTLAATGLMVFLPLMASMVEHYGWRSVALLVSAVAALAVPLVALLLPERPSDVGLRRYGLTADAPVEAESPSRNPLAIAFDALGKAMKMRDFWLLFFSFFVCGMSTNGYIGTQFIASLGTYTMSSVLMGVACFVGAIMVLRINGAQRDQTVGATA